MKNKRKLLKKQNDRSLEEKRSDKPNKSRAGFFLKLIGIFLLGTFIYFAVVITSNNDEGSVFERLDILKQEGQPYLVVLRDDFSPVGNESKKAIDNIIKKADDSIKVFDISYNPEEISKESKYFIDKFDVESLPVIILCDEKGDLINSYYLPFDEEQILGNVEKARESSVQ